MLRPGEDRNAPGLRQPFLEQLDAFADELDVQIAHAGKIAGRLGPALREVSVDRIAAEAEDHGRCGLQRSHGDSHELLRDDDLGIGCEDLAPRGFHVFPSGCPEDADRQIAAFDPAQLAQARAQGIQVGRGRVRASEPEPRDAPHPSLRAKRQRPSGRRAGNQFDEIAPSHVALSPMLRTTPNAA